jgi:hypothetical protein
MPIIGQVFADIGQVAAGIEQQEPLESLADWQPAASKTAIVRAANNEKRFNGFFI